MCWYSNTNFGLFYLFWSKTKERKLNKVKELNRETSSMNSE